MVHYVKILSSDLVHNGFKYKEGLNVDILPFDPSGSCKPGGLYFTDLKNFCKFLDYGNLVADVTIPDDAQVYADGGDATSPYKWKADRIILSNIRPIEKILSMKTAEELMELIKSKCDVFHMCQCICVLLIYAWKQ